MVAHIGTIRVDPEQWDVRVIKFPEQALLDDAGR